MEGGLNLAMILILLKCVLFYPTDAIQESAFTSKSQNDSLKSNKRYKRSGIYNLHTLPRKDSRLNFYWFFMFMYLNKHCNGSSELLKYVVNYHES